MKEKSLRLSRIIVIAGIVLAILASGLGISHAAGEFTLVDSYPKDGANNAAVENLGVKLTFSEAVDAETQFKENPDLFKLTGPNGSLPIKVYNNPKDETQILVLYDITTGGQIPARTSDTYIVNVSDGIVSKSGNVLSSPITITFDTINQSRSTRVYIVMMLLMMAGMAAFTMIQTNKKLRESEEGAGKDEPFNPYKEAKKTGKSVSEVLAEHEKEVAKKKAKEPKNVRIYDQEEEEEESGNYKVKGPRRISEGGSTYITGRKALAESRKEEAEKAKRRAQNKKKK